MSDENAVVRRRLVQFTYLNEVKSNVDSWYTICTNGRDSICIHKAEDDHILWYGPRIEFRASLFYNGVKGICLHGTRLFVLQFDRIVIHDASFRVLESVLFPEEVHLEHIPDAALRISPCGQRAYVMDPNRVCVYDLGLPQSKPTVLSRFVKDSSRFMDLVDDEVIVLNPDNLCIEKLGSASSYIRLLLIPLEVCKPVTGMCILNNIIYISSQTSVFGFNLHGGELRVQWDYGLDDHVDAVRGIAQDGHYLYTLVQIRGGGLKINKYI